MDAETLHKYTKAYLDSKHPQGEGAGGSGHLAYISLSEPEIEEWKELETKVGPIYEAVISYTHTRESEFGGQVTKYRERLLLSASGGIGSHVIIESAMYDLLTGEKISIEDFM